jgi:hypothetical protein
MEHDELDNKLTAWWLDIAPARQADLLAEPLPPMPWLAESISDAGLDAADVQRFLDAKRLDPQLTRDAGLNPKPN